MEEVLSLTFYVMIEKDRGKYTLERPGFQFRQILIKRKKKTTTENSER